MPGKMNDFRIEMKRITALDMVLIAAVLVLSIGIMVKVKLSQEAVAAVSTEAVVHSDGKEVQRIDLRNNGDVVLPGGKMVFEVQDGKIRVRRSDCHRQMCVHAGTIRFAGETIVCIPNKIVVEVAAGTMPVVDAVVF